MTPNTHLSGVFLHAWHTLSFTTINPHTKLEMCNFTRLKGTTGPKNLKVGHVILSTTIWGLFVIPRLILDVAYVGIKFEGYSFSG